MSPSLGLLQKDPDPSLAWVPPLLALARGYRGQGCEHFLSSALPPGRGLGRAAGSMGPGEDSPSPPLPFPSQLPLSSSHLNVYSGDPQVTASLVGVTSSSCPADLTQKRELTGSSSSLYLWGSPLPFFLPPFLSPPLCFSGLQMPRAGPWPRSGRRKTITT